MFNESTIPTYYWFQRENDLFHAPLNTDLHKTMSESIRCPRSALGTRYPEITMAESSAGRRRTGIWRGLAPGRMGPYGPLVG